MLDDKQFEMEWPRILKRIEMGHPRRAIAADLGLTMGQFRYRLKKFLDTSPEEPDQPMASASEREVSVTRDLAESQDRKSQVPPWELRLTQHLQSSIFDESWSRDWNLDRLVLLCREPTVVFAYWSTSATRKDLVSRHFQSDWNQLPFFLRLYDVTDILFNGENAHSTREYPVKPQSDNWYMSNVEPDRDYVADFGTRTLEGRFFTLVRSAPVRTPRNGAGDGPVYFRPLGFVESASPANVILNTAQSVPETPAADLGLEDAEKSTREHEMGMPPYAAEFDGYGSITSGDVKTEGGMHP